jgi:hypothetical protein
MIIYGMVHCVLGWEFSDNLCDGTVSYGEYLLMIYGMAHRVLWRVFTDILWDGTLCLMAIIYWYFMEWYKVSYGEYLLIFYSMVHRVF